jgi:thiol-disulfide isomerase/thioredoxin
MQRLWCLISCFVLWALPVWAGVTDNKYEGDIFVIYGGNGSLVPPRTTLEEARKRKEPVLLLFYVNDSKDCKAYAATITRLQVEFNRGVSFIVLQVDALQDLGASKSGQYFRGAVPHTVLFDRNGKVLFEKSGIFTYAQLKPYFVRMTTGSGLK